MEQAFSSTGAHFLFWVQDAATRSLQAITENWTISKYFFFLCLITYVLILYSML